MMAISWAFAALCQVCRYVGPEQQLLKGDRPDSHLAQAIRGR